MYITIKEDTAFKAVWEIKAMQNKLLLFPATKNKFLLEKKITISNSFFFLPEAALTITTKKTVGAGWSESSVVARFIGRHQSSRTDYPRLLVPVIKPTRWFLPKNQHLYTLRHNPTFVTVYQWQAYKLVTDDRHLWRVARFAVIGGASGRGPSQVSPHLWRAGRKSRHRWGSDGFSSQPVTGILSPVMGRSIMSRHRWWSTTCDR